MIDLIIKLSCLALCLLIGVFLPRTKPHITHKPLRRWKRCCLCGCYQNTTQDYCNNHEHPIYMLEASQRQQRRIHYHLNNIWTHPHLKRQQTAFVAFTLRLEDLSGDDWTTNAAISAFESIGPSHLYKFVEFMLGMEEATQRYLDVDDMIEQFLISEALEDDKEKITQN